MSRKNHVNRFWILGSQLRQGYDGLARPRMTGGGIPVSRLSENVIARNEVTKQSSWIAASAFGLLAMTMLLLITFFSTASFAQDAGGLCNSSNTIVIKEKISKLDKEYHEQIQNAFLNYKNYLQDDKYVFCLEFENDEAKKIDESVRLDISPDKKVIVLGLDIKPNWDKFNHNPTNPDNKYLLQITNTDTGRIEIRDSKFSNCANCVLATGKNIDIIGAVITGKQDSASDACVYTNNLDDSIISGINVSGCKTAILFQNSQHIDLNNSTVLGDRGIGNTCVSAKELKDSTITGMDISGCETGVLVYKSQNVRLGPDAITTSPSPFPLPQGARVIDYSNWNKIHENITGIYLMSENVVQLGALSPPSAFQAPSTLKGEGQIFEQRGGEIPTQGVVVQPTTTDNNGIRFAYNLIYNNTDNPADPNVIGKAENGIDLDDATVKRFGKLELVKYTVKDEKGQNLEKSLHCEFDKDGKITKRWLVFKTLGQGKVVIGKSSEREIAKYGWKTDNQFLQYITECPIDASGICVLTDLSDKWPNNECTTLSKDSTSGETTHLQAIYTGANSTEFLPEAFQDLMKITSTGTISTPSSTGEEMTSEIGGAVETASESGLNGPDVLVPSNVGEGVGSSVADSKMSCSLNTGSASAFSFQIVWLLLSLTVIFAARSFYIHSKKRDC